MKNLLILLLVCSGFCHAQEKVLVLEGNASALYLTHTTGPKENFYSIGRIYNISPRVIAPFNNLQLENGLSIGQVIKIPMTDVNFSQNGIIEEGELLVPLYHKAKSRETLGQISSMYHNVPVSLLKKWNRMSTDVPANGGNIIVGYLKIKKDLSPLAVRAVKVDPVDNSSAAVSVPAEISKPATNKEPVEVPAAKKDIVKAEPERTQVMKQVPAAMKESSERSFNGGFFRSQFSQSSSRQKTESGLAGVFKSTSGWEDGKYYCLHNSATPGTIVKITNPSGNKSVYAKVLDVIPDLRQNEGMIIRLSNAAADELGITTSTFDCTIVY